ncbi:MAG: pyridoxamine 5-phosphate oxidase [Mucilaginibacter sp.]|nr:pyridoxamine 5-phosphate oxidase [Mucilaginibacter sp.]
MSFANFIERNSSNYVIPILNCPTVMRNNYRSANQIGNHKYLVHFVVVYTRFMTFAEVILNIMRKNPEVCFQVDDIDDLLNWESVICWGKFEEITDMHEKTEVMQKIINWVMPLMHGETAQPSHGFTDNASDVGGDIELILYKIVLSKKTGRFEKGWNSGLSMIFISRVI